MGQETDHFVDFIAREILDMTRKMCASSANVDDPKELRGIVKAWLDTQNLKKRIWERVVFHTQPK